MKITKGLEKKWNEAVAVNSRDFYSKAMLDYLLKLVDLLEKEKKLTAGKLLDAMEEANDLKYTLNQQHGAMLLILKYWDRKDELNNLVVGIKKLLNNTPTQEVIIDTNDDIKLLPTQQSTLPKALTYKKPSKKTAKKKVSKKLKK